MARICSRCGLTGHNRKTCGRDASSSAIDVTTLRGDADHGAPSIAAPEHSDFDRPDSFDAFEFDVNDEVVVHYPWNQHAIVGTIDSVNYRNGNFYVRDRNTQRSYGCNFITAESRGILIERFNARAHAKKRIAATTYVPVEDAWPGTAQEIDVIDPQEDFDGVIDQMIGSTASDH